MDVAGGVVVLNGVPRSGKTSIAAALQAQTDRAWINIGIDHHIRTLPAWLSPGAGLRPYAVASAGTQADRTRLLRIEQAVPRLYAALYGSAPAHAQEGYDVVMDVADHGAYSVATDTLDACWARLDGLTRLLVGVQCPLDEIWRRRQETWGQTRDEVDDGVIAAVEGGQEAVHHERPYDLVIDTSVTTPAEAALLIRAALEPADS
jgi:chloramphenicol 3-O phosphotransferase